jgi:hypothetical protein
MLSHVLYSHLYRRPAGLPGMRPQSMTGRVRKSPPQRRAAPAIVPAAMQNKQKKAGPARVRRLPNRMFGLIGGPGRGHIDLGDKPTLHMARETLSLGASGRAPQSGGRPG